MFRRIVLASAGSLVLAAVFALGLSATRWETADALTNCTTTSDGLDGDETTVIQLINQHRVSAGLPALLVAPSLNRAAAWKSADPSNTGSGGVAFGHTDSLGRSSSQRASDCGYPGGAAENIAYGYSATGVVAAWMDSPGHRANILSGYYAVIGAGHTGSSWVVDFGLSVEPGSYALGSAPPAAPPATATPTPAGSAPSPTQSTGGNPTAGNGGAVSGGNTGNPQATTPASTQGSQPAVRTVLPARPFAQYELPSNAPVRRALMQMVASE